MIKFLLGISITLNVISMIAFFIIYKYSLRGLKSKIENMAIKNFSDFDFDFDDLEKKMKKESDLNDSKSNCFISK